MTSPDKSLLSNHTLDTSINHNFPMIPPLHAGHTSYHLHKACKTIKDRTHPLPFASTASRITSNLEPSPSSHIVGYTDVYRKEEKEEEWKG